METWIEFQKETMGKLFQMTSVGAEEFKSFNPLQFTNFKELEVSKENAKKITDNNLKYHKAFIAYHQALHDMMEAFNDNTKIMSNQK